MLECCGAARQMCSAWLVWAMIAGALLGGPTVVLGDTRITLRPEMIVNETAIGDASKLVDEQDAVGEPGEGKGKRPERPFFPGWTSWQYPVSVFVDLGAECELTRALIYNDTGEHKIVLSTGRPFDWKPREVTLGGYREWRPFDLNVKTRYLRITLAQPTSISELVLYGKAQPTVPPAKPPARRPSTQQPMDQFIGTNAFIDDPVDKLAVPVGFVREYHNWSWDTEAPDHQVRFQPSGAAGGNSWFFDDYYAKLLASGVTVCPAIQGSSPVYFPGHDNDAKPIAAGADSESPASYSIHAAHLYQYAARYGSASVPDSALKLGSGQPRRSGLKLLKYLEDWNEPDKTWKGREGRFSPYDLAAMCSADYDGDQGRMGAGFGVQAADPQMRLSIGGLAGIGLPYLKAMKVWADWHRKGDFPADVINLHHYSSDGTAEQPFKTQGISPEADHLREKMAEIVAWRNANVPKCEIWLTEFGYDTNPKSPFHSPAIGPFTAEEVQAIWLVRSYLALAAAGVDRAAMFMFRDVKSDGSGVFETSGMVTEKGQWKAKPSYYYIAALKKRLSGMRYAGDIPTGNKDVLIYRFIGPGGNSAAVAWCSTSDGRKVAGVKVPVPGSSVTRVDFTNTSTDGVASPVRATSGAVTIEASEKPTILLFEGVRRKPGSTGVGATSAARIAEARRRAVSPGWRM